MQRNYKIFRQSRISSSQLNINEISNTFKFKFRDKSFVSLLLDVREKSTWAINYDTRSYDVSVIYVSARKISPPPYRCKNNAKISKIVNGFLEFRKIYLPVFILRRRFVARNKRNNFGSPSHRNFHPGR